MQGESFEVICGQARHPRTPVSGSQTCHDHGKLGLRELYFALSSPGSTPEAGRRARAFLREQLRLVSTRTADLPADFRQLPTWMEQRTEQVGCQFRDYQNARRAGGARRYFSNRSHALYFLQAVAPTKLVDGAWLAGLPARWQDPRFTTLIRIYLEELGDGQPDKNHVLLYRKLLARHGLDGWDQLSEEHYVQGTLQLALARHTDEFLPELVGYNLGYEQLPLHLLITAYELRELGIDPYYFTLHVTVDNAATGHARRALQGVRETWPVLGDATDFQRRLRRGYLLNDLGASTLSVIAAFDLERELIQCLARKSRIGRYMHNGRCRIAGREINDWLAEPDRIPDFLAQLERHGWIRRHRPVRESRFWRLIQGERASMYGVFNAYEQQLIQDWIEGELAQESPSARSTAVSPVFPPPCPRPAAPRPHRTVSESASADANQELALLQQELAALPDKEAQMNRLVSLMSPARHHTGPGLLATRLFARMFP